MGKGKGPYLCGLDAAVDVVGGKWKPLILWALYAGRTLRFGELRRDVPGVSEKMLIQQLREMEADGIVHREVYREVPPRVEYSLTDLGQSLNEALEPLGLWGDRHMERLVARQSEKTAAERAAKAERAARAEAARAERAARTEHAAKAGLRASRVVSRATAVRGGHGGDAGAATGATGRPA